MKMAHGSPGKLQHLLEMLLELSARLLVQEFFSIAARVLHCKMYERFYAQKYYIVAPKCYYCDGNWSLALSGAKRACIWWT